jgi:hypothetical protein
MSTKSFSILMVVLLGTGCGGTHDVGEDSGRDGQSQTKGDGGQNQTQTEPECMTHQECAGGACDVGICRTACGSNYPDNMCASGETCSGWICRPTCEAGCGAGTACDEGDGVCKPVLCSEENPCPSRYGCSDGFCRPVGNPCILGQCDEASLVCSDGTCRMPCGPQYTENTCPAAWQCVNDEYCAAP